MYKILQFIDSLTIGGAERMCVNISNVLNRDGNKVYLCISRNSGELEAFIDDNIEICRLKKRSKFDLFAFLRLLKFVINNKIEIIHAHSSSIYWVTLIKIFKPSLLVVWHDHYGLSESLTDKDRKVLKFCSYFIDAIISVNETLKKWSLKNMKVKGSKIVFINNFPLLPVINRLNNREEINLLCMANFREQKDHITLIKAISIVLSKKPDSNIKLILAGTYSDNEYYRNVLELIHNYNLKDVVSIRGAVQNIADLLAITDIGILSSVSEGLPVTLLEYGLAKLPVVVTDVGQCSDVIGAGKYGWLVKSQSPDELANALIYIIDNIEEAKLKGIDLHSHVTKNYGGQSFVQKYYSLINS